jgi:hypothetical protein
VAARAMKPVAQARPKQKASATETSDWEQF